MRRLSRRLGLCLAFIHALAAIPLSAASYPSYVIGPGDLLSITLFGERELPTQFLVDTEGYVTYPLVGELKVGGLTQNQAGVALEKALAHYLRTPQATVLIAESNAYMISVLGEVGHPGRIRIRGTPRLLNVLAEAGGPLPSANLSGVVLIHDGKRKPLDLSRFYNDSRGPDTQALLFPGDAILVPRSAWPNLGEWAIITSFLTSAALLATTVDNWHNRP